MDIIIKVLQLILSLSILVITHEGGHFLFAKLFKTRVEKFYLFFDPWFSLFKFQKGETEYGIGWLPLGGYVKIAGMIDESMDKEQMEQPMQPWEFRAKPAWQRLVIILGGVFVNIISAPLILWGILFTWGETYIPINEAPQGLQFHEVMHEAGFVDGDIVVGVNGNPVHKYKDVSRAVIFEDTCIVNVVRNGENIDIKMPHEFYRSILSNKAKSLCSIRIPVIVDSIIPDSYAEKGGLLPNDSIVAINGNDASTVDMFINILSQSKDKDIQLSLYRNGILDTLCVHVSDEGKIGINLNTDIKRWTNIVHKEYGFFEALPAGIRTGYEILRDYIFQLPMLFTKEGATQVGGFGTIGNMFGASWDWEHFWYNTAFLAIMLGVMNILPIPALDGGHALFILIEMITGRKPSDKFLEYAQTFGMILLLALMLYANVGDIIRAFFS